jgi:hypothetical protein
MRKLYVQNREEAAVVKESESSMEKQIKDLMEKVVVLDSKTEDSVRPGEAPPSRKSGFFKKIVSKITDSDSEKNGETKRLLMELETLGMSIGETC